MCRNEATHLACSGRFETRHRATSLLTSLLTSLIEQTIRGEPHVACATLRCEAELVTDHIGDLLRHYPRGRGLAPGDRDEAIHAIVCVIEALEGAAHLARIRAALDNQRAGDSHFRAHRYLSNGGQQLLALVDHLCDMLRRYLDQVWVFDLPRCGADGRGSALRHDNIAIRWLVEAVQDHVAEPAVKCHHDACGRRHGNLHAG